MAKVTGALYSISASGNIKKTIVYTSFRNTPVVKRFSKPTDLDTDEQQAIRGVYKDGTIAWNNLSEFEKDVYKERAKTKKMTGFNLFMQEYLNEYIPLIDVARYEEDFYESSNYGAD